MSKLLVLLLLNFCSVIFSDQIGPRIFGGRDAKLGEFPHQVSIQTSKHINPVHFCGGSIIAASWILTAAHCTKHDLHLYIIVAGITNIDDTHPERQERKAKKLINHGHFTTTEKTIRNDISLIELDRPLEFNRYLKTIELPKPGFEFLGDAVAIGWGKSNSPSFHNPNTLQAVTLSVIPTSECKVPVKFEQETHICTSSNSTAGVCYGDSGGPLIYNQQIVGVASFVAPRCGVFGFFTKVSGQIDFIKTHVKI